MKEWVGKCVECGCDVYCHDGFLGGVQTAEGSLFCFDCADKSGPDRDQSSKQPIDSE